MSTVVPALCWVPKGVPKEVPDKVELSSEEVQKLLQDAHGQLKGMGLKDLEESQLEDAGIGDGGQLEEEEEGSGGAGEEETIEALYDMEHYDSDEGHGQKMSGAGMGNCLAGLTFYPSNKEDPFITLKNMPPDEEDYKIVPTDNLLVVGKAEEDFSSIEIHVFNEEDDHSYSHHEILLTSFPLTIEWLDYDPEQPHNKGNYIAIGTMTPVIEVWDLDTIDVLEPVFCLGDFTSGRGALSLGKKKKKGKSSEAKHPPKDGHTDSVLAISWNRAIRNILASASADGTVRVWDLAWPKSVLTLRHPKKVQCCLWHPYQQEVLATGAYDGFVRLFNCKDSETAIQSWDLSSEVEKLVWNHFKPEQLLAASEKQTVWCFNMDNGSTLFQIHAHNSAIVDLSLSCYMPGLLVTAGSDDTIKFWDIQDDKPVFLLSREMHMGGVMCCKFCVDSPYALAVAGTKNGFHIVNILKLPDVVEHFKNRDLMMPVPATSSSHDETCIIASGGGGLVSEQQEAASSPVTSSDATSTLEDGMEVDEDSDKASDGQRTEKVKEMHQKTGSKEKKKKSRTKKKH